MVIREVHIHKAVDVSVSFVTYLEIFEGIKNRLFKTKESHCFQIFNRIPSAIRL